MNSNTSLPLCFWTAENLTSIGPRNHAGRVDTHWSVDSRNVPKNPSSEQPNLKTEQAMEEEAKDAGKKESTYKRPKYYSLGCFDRFDCVVREEPYFPLHKCGEIISCTYCGAVRLEASNDW